MFPLDDGKFYTESEMADAILTVVEFVHVSKEQTEVFLKEHFGKFSEETADLIRGYNSGILPRLYRPAETIFLFAEKFGIACLFCQGVDKYACDKIPAAWVTDFPHMRVLNRLCPDDSVNFGLGVICRDCYKSTLNEYAKITGNKPLYWDFNFESPEMFFSCMLSALRKESFQARIRENIKHYQWRFSPRLKNMERDDEH